MTLYRVFALILLVEMLVIIGTAVAASAYMRMALEHLKRYVPGAYERVHAVLPHRVPLLRQVSRFCREDMPDPVSLQYQRRAWTLLRAYRIAFAMGGISLIALAVADWLLC